MGGAGSWALTAQIGFAEARAGDDRGLAVSRDAFAAALRLRPGDVKLLTQSALIWLESGDAPRARQLAEQALARDSGEWLAWAVLARASKRLGNDPEAQDAAARARALVPPEARRVLDDVLR
jgi:Tfp pilus assembly protein PilF